MKLNNKVAIILPTLTKEREEINSDIVDNFKKQIMTKFSYITGGASVIKQEGAYLSETEGLMIEDNYLIYAHCDDYDLNELIGLTEQIAIDMELDLKQESVMYEVNGVARFS